ncbi:MAG: hypothetical protein M1335_03980 [Chloroflexi bacterium]|nr:hypothetical protein [Chloroflexota bacterium]
MPVYKGQPQAAVHLDQDGVWVVALDAAKVRFEDGWHKAKTGAVFRARPKEEQAQEGRKRWLLLRRMTELHIWTPHRLVEAWS